MKLDKNRQIYINFHQNNINDLCNNDQIR